MLRLFIACSLCLAVNAAVYYNPNSNSHYSQGQGYEAPPPQMGGNMGGMGMKAFNSYAGAVPGMQGQDYESPLPQMGANLAGMGLKSLNVFANAIPGMQGLRMPFGESNNNPPQGYGQGLY